MEIELENVKSDSNKFITIQTHNGKFHADDISSCSLMTSYYQNKGYEVSIVRSRDPKTFSNSDILLDVGCEYDPENGRFDHHQSSWKETYDENSNIPMSSVGSIWKYYGSEIISMFISNNEEFKDKNYEKHILNIQTEIYYKVILEIDADDNGIPLTNGNTNYKQSLTFPKIIDSMNHTETYNDVIQLERFNEALKVCGNLLNIKFSEIIRKYFLYLEDSKLVKHLIHISTYGSYLILPKQISTIFRCLKELDPDNKIKFIIYPNEDDRERYYTIRTRSIKQDFSPMIPLLDLNILNQIIHNPEQLLFVHKNLFVAKTTTLEAAKDVIDFSIRDMTPTIEHNVEHNYLELIKQNKYPVLGILGVAGVFITLFSWSKDIDLE